MAISFVGSAVGSSSPNTTTTITLPTLQADDLIVIAAAVGDTANNGIPAPTGYSRVPGVAATLYANDLNDTNLDLYYKIAVAGDSGATVTLAATGGTNASNAGIAMVFRGVDTTTPFDVNATTATGISTSNADPPSIDHLNPAGVLTVIAASTGHTGTATATFTFPSGYTTNAAQRAHNDTIDVLVGMGYRTNPADPENPPAFSASGIGTAADNAWAAVTMALRPAVASPTRGLVSFAEQEAPFVATRGFVSHAEMESPLAPTRGLVSFAEAEAPLAPTRGLLSWTEQEVPFPPASPTRGLISWAEQEVPLQPTRGLVSWAEAEAPLAPTRGLVSWAEVETGLAPTRGQLSVAEMEAPFAPTRGLLSFAELAHDEGQAPGYGWLRRLRAMNGLRSLRR